MIGGELDHDTIQTLFDAALRVTLKIAPRGLDPLASHLLERFRATTGHEQLRKRCAIPFSRETIELLLKDQGLDTSQIKSKLDHMLQIFRNPGTAFDFHELQIRFLLFHELAHYFLGHLNQAISNDQEFEADRHAADLLFKYIDNLAESSVSAIAPSAILALFLHMSFVEDLIGLYARCTKFAMKEDFRPYVRQVHYDHPRAYNRVRRIMGSFPNKFNADHVAVALLMQYGIYHTKRCIQLGLVDLKNLKYFCRVRAIEQTHRAVMLLLNPEHKMQFVDKLEYSTAWYSDDLMPGPLVTEVFEGDWNQTIF
jgi:hypothetical protein